MYTTARLRHAVQYPTRKVLASLSLSLPFYWHFTRFL